MELLSYMLLDLPHVDITYFIWSFQFCMHGCISFVVSSLGRITVAPTLQIKILTSVF